MHFSPMAVGFLGSLASIAKYLSVVVASGRMCRQIEHSAKWNKRGASDGGGFGGADISISHCSVGVYSRFASTLLADQRLCSNEFVFDSANDHEICSISSRNTCL